jgi:hypothetical protein
VLEIEGKKLFQFSAIGRFLARRFKLVGDTEDDAVQCDIAVETMQDIRISKSA